MVELPIVKSLFTLLYIVVVWQAWSVDERIFFEAEHPYWGTQETAAAQSIRLAQIHSSQLPWRIQAAAWAKKYFYDTMFVTGTVLKESIGFKTLHFERAPRYDTQLTGVLVWLAICLLLYAVGFAWQEHTLNSRFGSFSVGMLGVSSSLLAATAFQGIFNLMSWLCLLMGIFIFNRLVLP